MNRTNILTSIFIIVVCVGTGVGVVTYMWFGVIPQSSDLPSVVSSFNSNRDIEEVPRIESIPDRIARGDTLSTILGRNGFTAIEIYEVAQALSSVTDVRSLRPGNEVKIHYDSRGRPSLLRLYTNSPFWSFEALKTESGWRSETRELVLNRRILALTGTLEENLFQSISSLGEGAPLTIAFANVFAWDFDFYTQRRSGDEFSLVVEKLYDEGKFVGYGDLLAARYVSYLSKERALTAFLYEDPSGVRDYYDSEGKSTRKAFLRAPLEFSRISSGFSRSRFHPIHKRRMPHLGVDYAAKTGTPVYSVAAGTISSRAYTKGGGNTVTIKHAMGYTTKYLHLSRFKSGLHTGQRVSQKEVIGFVGMTGTATGPHLDFRLTRHGKPVNPTTQIFPPGPPVAKEFFSDFELRRIALAKQLEAPSLTANRRIEAAGL